MQKREKEKSTSRQRRFPLFGSLKGLCFAGAMTAMSIVLGKFLQIPNPFGEFIRISFENLPILLVGFALGPSAAVAVGVAADLIGCVLYGYTVNPIITLGAAAVGLVCGITSNYVIKKPLSLHVGVSVAISHLFGSVLIKSYGLATWYLAKYELGYWEFVGWRGVNYALIAAAECTVIYLLLRNSGFRKQLERMKR